MKKIIAAIAALGFVSALSAQQPRTPGIMKEGKPGYFQNTIMKDIRAVDDSIVPVKKEKRFTADLSGMTFPNKVSLYQQEWRLPPVSQGNTNTCWCFSTTSFFESEVHRLTGQEIKLSEMYTVYWEYIERAVRFVRERGNSAFAEGAEANAVVRDFKKYGIVPREVYDGMEPGRKFYSHEKMFGELKSYMEALKTTNGWDENQVVATVKSILDHYMGTPPEKFTWKGKEYTPKEFLSSVLKLQMDDYVDILSYLQQPFWQKVEYEVPDNWWHSKEYHNVPLEAFYGIIKRSIQRGYSIAIGGDTSEPGIVGDEDIAVIPTFDIPGPFIDQYSREMRFSNRTSTDDHGIHIVGYTSLNGTEWFLIKDSGRGGHRGLFKGYIFYRADYIKLKMLTIMVHKDMASDLLKKFPKP